DPHRRRRVRHARQGAGCLVAAWLRFAPPRRSLPLRAGPGGGRRSRGALRAGASMARGRGARPSWPGDPRCRWLGALAPHRRQSRSTRHLGARSGARRANPLAAWAAQGDRQAGAPRGHPAPQWPAHREEALMAVAQGHVPRLLHLVRLLEKHGEMSLADGASAVGVSGDELAERVRRLSRGRGGRPVAAADLVEIEIEGGRVRLGRGLLRLPRFQLTAEEVAGLRLAARLAEAEGWGESRALKRALGKLEDALVPEERERGRKLAKRLAFAGVSPDQARKLEVIERAMSESRAVEIVYFTDSSETGSERA